jgi:hypothetical protein
MSQKYHVNAMGNAAPCKATQGGCPFGDDSDHYSTPEDARAAYESAMEDNITSYLQKKGKKIVPNDINGFTVETQGNPSVAPDTLATKSGHNLVVSQSAVINGVPTTVYSGYKVNTYWNYDGGETDVDQYTYLTEYDLLNNRPASRPKRVHNESATDYSENNGRIYAQRKAQEMVNSGKVDVRIDDTVPRMTRARLSESGAEDVQSMETFTEELSTSGDIKAALSSGFDKKSGQVSSEFYNMYSKLYGKQHTSERGKAFMESALRNGEVNDLHSARSLNKLAYPSYTSNAVDVPMRQKTRDQYIDANIAMAKARGLRETGEIMRALKMSGRNNKEIHAIMSDRALDAAKKSEIYHVYKLTDRGEYVWGEENDQSPY